MSRALLVSILFVTAMIQQSSAAAAPAPATVQTAAPETIATMDPKMTTTTAPLTKGTLAPATTTAAPTMATAPLTKGTVATIATDAPTTTTAPLTKGSAATTTTTMAPTTAPTMATAPLTKGTVAPDASTTTTMDPKMATTTGPLTKGTVVTIATDTPTVTTTMNSKMTTTTAPLAKETLAPATSTEVPTITPMDPKQTTTADPTKATMPTAAPTIGTKATPTGICPSSKSTTMDDDGRQKMLDAHNNYRSALGSGKQADKNGTLNGLGQNMYKLVWDCDLEDQAYKWANTCLWQPSPTSARNKAGENILALNYPAAKDPVSALLDAAKTWWSQVTTAYAAKTGNTYVSKTDKRSAGFMQMAYGHTYSVGCSWTLCPGIAGYKDGTYVVCRYNDAWNNVENAVIYEPGLPCICSGTPEKSSCDMSTGLCVKAV